MMSDRWRVTWPNAGTKRNTVSRSPTTMRPTSSAEISAITSRRVTTAAANQSTITAAPTVLRYSSAYFVTGDGVWVGRNRVPLHVRAVEARQRDDARTHRRFCCSGCEVRSWLLTVSSYSRLAKSKHLRQYSCALTLRTFCTSAPSILWHFKQPYRRLR
jgi:hypothetical protein